MHWHHIEHLSASLAAGKQCLRGRKSSQSQFCVSKSVCKKLLIFTSLHSPLNVFPPSTPLPPFPTTNPSQKTQPSPPQRPFSSFGPIDPARRAQGRAPRLHDLQPALLRQRAGDARRLPRNGEAREAVCRLHRRGGRDGIRTSYRNPLFLTIDVPAHRRRRRFRAPHDRGEPRAAGKSAVVQQHAGEAVLCERGCEEAQGGRSRELGRCVPQGGAEDAAVGCCVELGGHEAEECECSFFLLHGVRVAMGKVEVRG